jgi:hypothetical protein
LNFRCLLIPHSAVLFLLSDGHKPGWQSVPAHDPQVQDAANHAVKTIQQRSNSLVPYELHEVSDAKAEVSALFLVLKCHVIELLVVIFCLYFRL